MYYEEENHDYWKQIGEMRKSFNKKSQMSLRDVLVLAHICIMESDISWRTDALLKTNTFWKRAINAQAQMCIAPAPANNPESIVPGSI